jgi:hypothetical protein
MLTLLFAVVAIEHPNITKQNAHTAQFNAEYDWIRWQTFILLQPSKLDTKVAKHCLWQLQDIQHSEVLTWDAITFLAKIVP